MKKQIAVLGSGSGSNFEAVIQYFFDKGYNDLVEFSCITDKENAYIRNRAKKLGVKSDYVPFKETYNYLRNANFDLIVLAGYMRILPVEVLNIGTFINIHPSLLPSFKGMTAIKDAYNYGVKITGVTVHYVVEEVDAGEIIAQSPVFIEPKMSFEELEQKIHQAEHALYPKVVEQLFENLLKNTCSII